MMAIRGPNDRARNTYQGSLPTVAGELLVAQEGMLELIESGVIGAGG